MHVTLPPQSNVPSIILIGMECNFTHLVLRDLLDRGIPVAAVVLPGKPGAPVPLQLRPPTGHLPLAGTTTNRSGVTTAAHDAGIPVYRFGSLVSAAAQETLTSFNADILLSACYPRLIPGRATRLFPGGAVNIHPSLLPQLRGPDPLFWTFRCGLDESGVSIHALGPSFDGGPVLAQERVTIPDGFSEKQLETTSARVAVEMLETILARVQSGKPLQPTIQDETAATWAPHPDEDDFRLLPSMTARQAFNFVRGVAERGVPITVRHDGVDHVVLEAITYGTSLSTISPDETVTAVRFRDGYLMAKLGPL